MSSIPHIPNSIFDRVYLLLIPVVGGGWEGNPVDSVEHVLADLTPLVDPPPLLKGDKVVNVNINVVEECGARYGQKSHTYLGEVGFEVLGWKSGVHVIGY